MVEPIKPKDVGNLKKKNFPDAVIEAFNELIAENYNNGYATIAQKDVVARMVKKGLKRKDISDNNWLDVEPIYRSAGWEVTYDGPGYNESYEPTFTFKKKGMSNSCW